MFKSKIANLVYTKQSDKVNKITSIFLVLCITFWMISITIHDWLDPQVNLEFIKYVLHGSKAHLSMQIDNSILVQLIFYITLVFESLIIILLTYASFSMLRSFYSTDFYRHKIFAIYAILLCIFKYFVLFVCIAAEWFYMWQTAEMAQIKASIFTAILVGILLILLLTSPTDRSQD